MIKKLIHSFLMADKRTKVVSEVSFLYKAKFWNFGHSSSRNE